MSKRILSLALAGTLVLGSATAFAANDDIRNKVTGENAALTDVLFNQDAFFEVAFNQENYTIEFNGNLYNLEEVQAKFEANPDIEMEEAVEGLESVGKAEEEGLKVVEVSAINNNYVTVAITAPEKDLLAQEVEVKNGVGVVVAVKPLDIAAGDEIAEFEFVTAVKAADLVGVWTVNGQSYDLDVYNKIVDVLEATTQIELDAALVALDLENYDSANVTEYFKAQQKLVGTVEATELTVADIQKMVDDANDKVAEGKDEVALIKAIKDAKTADNQVAYLAALNNAGLTQVNPEWVSVDVNGYFENIDGTEANLKAIQAKINTANETILPGKVTNSGIDKAKLTESKELIEKYAPLTDKGVISNSGIKISLEKIEEQLAVVAVLEATTPTALKARLTELAKLVDNTATIDMKNYKDANGKAYVKAIADETNKVANLATAGNLGTLLITVNGNQETGLVGEVKVAALEIKNEDDTVTADQKAALIKALNDLGVKQVEVSNIDKYIEDAIVTALSEIMDLDDAQTQVDTANLAAVKGSTENTIIDKLNVFELDNIVEANAEDYAKSAITTTGAINLVTVGVDNKATVANLKAAVTTVNKEVAENSDVKAINEAKTAEEVKDALDGLAIAKYLDVTPSDRIFIAEEVLDARSKITTPTAIEFENKAAVEVAVDNAAVARTNAIAGVNILKLDSTLTKVANALLAVGHDSLTGKVNEPTANDTAIADKFITSLIDEDGALSLNFRSIADIRAVLSSL